MARVPAAAASTPGTATCRRCERSASFLSQLLPRPTCASASPRLRARADPDSSNESASAAQRAQKYLRCGRPRASERLDAGNGTCDRLALETNDGIRDEKGGSERGRRLGVFPADVVHVKPRRRRPGKDLPVASAQRDAAPRSPRRWHSRLRSLTRRRALGPARICATATRSRRAIDGGALSGSGMPAVPNGVDNSVSLTVRNDSATVSPFVKKFMNVRESVACDADPQR